MASPGKRHIGARSSTGFSGLIPERRAGAAKYVALNELTIRGVFLALTAWEDDPPELFVLENVPRIQTRGRHLLDQIVALLNGHGYSVAETTYCCGELGGLAQRRQRYLLVARHREKVRPLLFQPDRRPLRGVGEVIGDFPVPGAPEAESAGPMHALPRLHWRTWVRLALVEAGSDWRSLQKLEVRDGVVAGVGLLPETGERWWRGPYGVCGWGDTAATVTGSATPARGAFAVADPRPDWSEAYGQLGVIPWADPAGTVTSQRSPGQGRFAIADLRMSSPHGSRYRNKYRLIRWGGAASVADPRTDRRAWNNVFRLARWVDPSQAVTAGSGPSAGGQAVADPRLDLGGNWGGGPFGVLAWEGSVGAVVGCARHDNGRFSFADPRLPEPTDRLEAVIVALDGTWHRPFTTLELAALQGLVDPGEHLRPRRQFAQRLAAEDRERGSGAGRYCRGVDDRSPPPGQLDRDLPAGDELRAVVPACRGGAVGG